MGESFGKRLELSTPPETEQLEDNKLGVHCDVLGGKLVERLAILGLKPVLTMAPGNVKSQCSNRASRHLDVDFLDSGVKPFRE